MAFLGLFKKSGQRKVTPYKRGQKVEYQPKVAYNPSRSKVKHIGVKLKSRRKNINWKLILSSLIGTLIISVAIYGIVMLLKSDALAVKKFRLLGNRTINDIQVSAALQKFTGTNILLVKSESIEKELASTFSIFNGIEVTKYFPNELFIKISEREPKLVYINLSGAYLVDAKGQILQQIFVDPVVVIDEKLNIARGLGDPNSEYLKQMYAAEFIVANSFQEKPLVEQQALIAAGFKLEAISLNDRQARMKILQKTFQLEFETAWDKNSQAVDTSAYSSYPRVAVLDAQVFKSGEQVDLERLNLTTDIMNLFSGKKLQFTRIIWEGELLVKVEFADKKEIVFGLDRKITDQFEDYLLVVNQLQREGRDYCQIDVSASRIAVRQCK